MVIPVPAPLNGAIIVGGSSIIYIDSSDDITLLPLNQVNYSKLKIIYYIHLHIF